MILRFTDFTGRYEVHCHNLEHEDDAMMAQFQVLPPISATLTDPPGRKGLQGRTDHPATRTPATGFRTSMGLGDGWPGSRRRRARVRCSSSLGIHGFNTVQVAPVRAAASPERVARARPKRNAVSPRYCGFRVATAITAQAFRRDLVVS